jgi:hypothetical protein
LVTLATESRGGVEEEIAMPAEPFSNEITDVGALEPSRHPRRPPLGAPVEVRSSFEGNWCAGFEIAEVVVGRDGVEGFRVRRLSDGALLPAVFPPGDLIPGRRRTGRWPT